MWETLNQRKVGSLEKEENPGPSSSLGEATLRITPQMLGKIQALSGLGDNLGENELWGTVSGEEVTGRERDSAGGRCSTQN